VEKFLKIYVWQIISLIFNFASLFVVTPYLSSNNALYGIYTLVVAAYIFLSYADFGFLGAGMKFAAEYFAQKNQRQEIRVIGFASFIFLMFVIIYALCIFYISFHPQIIVKNLSSGAEIDIASHLLLILAVFSPIFVLQRMLTIIFAVRLEDYIFQRILIVSNIIKISIALCLFGSGKYPIVTYFFVVQICSLGAVLAGLLTAKKRLGYDLKLLFGSVRFSKELYNKTKSLAFVSIFLTVCWVIYYETDPFVISRLLGAKYLAVYAIGFSLMEYFRSIFGIVFSPFSAKFNHFIGVKDYNGLKSFFNKILTLALPVTVFPVLAVSISIKSFIYSWVGQSYALSVPIAQVLVLSYLFSFISSPTGILVMAYERVRLLYITSALLPLVYWLGILVTYQYWHLQAFANFKLFSFFIIAVVYFTIVAKLLNLGVFTFFWNLLKPAIIPVIFIATTLILTRSYFPYDKSKANLFLYFAYNALIILSANVIYYFSSPAFRESINGIVATIFAKLAVAKKE
jgi:O-antigen/teichoic acid export membrane protein